MQGLLHPAQREALSLQTRQAMSETHFPGVDAANEGAPFLPSGTSPQECGGYRHGARLRDVGQNAIDRRRDGRLTMEVRNFHFQDHGKWTLTAVLAAGTSASNGWGQ